MFINIILSARAIWLLEYVTLIRQLDKLITNQKPEKLIGLIHQNWLFIWRNSWSVKYRYFGEKILSSKLICPCLATKFMCHKQDNTYMWKILESMPNLYGQDFLGKIVIQNLMCEIWCIFKEKWFILFPQKRGAVKRKC